MFSKINFYNTAPNLILNRELEIKRSMHFYPFLILQQLISLVPEIFSKSMTFLSSCDFIAVMRQKKREAQTHRLMENAIHGGFLRFNTDRDACSLKQRGRGKRSLSRA